MVKRIKLFVAVVISMLILAGLPVFASSPQTKGYTLSEKSITKMAENAAAGYIGWGNVETGKIHELQDFTGKVIGYSVDLTNKDTKQEGYIFLGSCPNDDPIIQYSKDVLSPYDNLQKDNDICIYDGVGKYYAKSSINSNYYSVIDSTLLADDDVNIMLQNDKQKSYSSGDIQSSQKLRNQLLSNTTDNMRTLVMLNSSVTDVLNVPFYTQPDTNSCTPTSAAMGLRYLYSNVPPDRDTSVRELERTMQWQPTTGVSPEHVVPGINGAMQAWGSVGFNGAFDSVAGRSHSTFGLVETSINSGHPLLIDCTERNIKYSGHAMCIVGYQDIGLGVLVIHDTWGTSNVYVNYIDDASIGNNFHYTYM